MTMPDDDLESIEDATNIRFNVGTRRHWGARQGKSSFFNKPRSRLQRIFASAKGCATRKQNKAITQRPAHD